MVDKYLLVDTSYVIFYRFYAIKRWYLYASTEKDNINNKDYNWLEDETFMNKYNKTFLDGIIIICKKNNIKYENVIFSIDGCSKDIWRHDNAYENEKYKGTRDDNKNFNDKLYEIFSHTIDNIIKPFINLKKSHIIQIDKLEADDINAVIALKCIDTTVNYVYILSSDTDYIQLCNNNVKMINMKGDILCDKHLKTFADGTQYLIHKILRGDVSDNIGACSISSNILIKYGIYKTSKRKWIKINKKLATRIISNKDLYRAIHDDIFIKFRNGGVINIEDEIFGNKKFTSNQKMIDFYLIPSKYISKVINEFKKNMTN